MERLPFDPSRMSGPPKPRKEDALSVSEVAERIEGALRAGLPGRIRLLGEISGFTDRNHWYFDVKDEAAVLSCVMFASDARRQQYRPESGQEVILTGRVAFYTRGGRTQFYASRIEPVGAGELELRYRALCAELRELGWFDPESKQRLPFFPCRVAVVTSRTGAALQDVLDTFRRRCPAIEIVSVDVRVQGEGAAPEVAHAIRAIDLARDDMGIDAVIVTRGGGSMEDLWAFNEREVAAAIRACRVPVVAAIGHETDTTIAELVADERCATPTQAAMRLSPDRASLDEQLSHLSRRLTTCLKHGLVVAQHRLDAAMRYELFAAPRGWLEARADRLTRTHEQLSRALRDRQSGEHLRVERLTSRLARRRPEAVLEGRRVAIPHMEERLTRALRSRLNDARRGTTALERELRAVSPVSVLGRGYSMTTRQDGSMVRRESDVKPGDLLTTRVADGEIRSRVEGESPVSPPKPRRRRNSDSTDQASLF